jgi:hypothetical protein
MKHPIEKQNGAGLGLNGIMGWSSLRQKKTFGIELL